MTLNVVFENRVFHPHCTSMWGFACHIPQMRLLFDTGSNGAVLLGNMEAMGIEPREIETVVLSHFHWDHAGGLLDLLRAHGSKDVYLHSGFSRTFASEASGLGARVIMEDSPIKITPEAVTTGAVPGPVTEQGLVVRGPRGWILLTGCAHPGIVRMTEEAIRVVGEPVHMVLGGFHLLDRTTSQVTAVAKRLMEMGVSMVAPCHCTGERAIETFADIYGDAFVRVGAGTSVEITAT